MARPKSGTEEGNLAVSRWRETMTKKYGEEGFREFMSRAGRKGGLAKTPTAGFGSDKVGADGLTGRQRAYIAGKKGGSISSRAGILNGQGKRHREDDIDRAERIMLEELKNER